MNNLTLNLREIRNKYSRQNLAQILNKNKGKIALIFPGDCIGNSQSSADVANDYLEILYAGERLAEVCESIKEHFENGSVHFILKPCDKEDFVNVLFEVLDVIEWADEDSEFEFIDYRDEFMENLEQKAIKFPETGDSFLANFVNGIRGFEDQEYIDDLYDRFPEWKYRFWRSFVSDELNYEVFVSTYAWIVPHSTQGKGSDRIVRDILRKYAGFKGKPPLFYDVQWISAAGLPPIAFHKYGMTSYPYDAIEVARECVAEIREREFEGYTPDKLSKKEKAILEAVESAESHKEAVSSRLSEDGEILIAKDKIAHYIFFRESHEFSEMMGSNPKYQDIFLNTFINTGGSGLYEIPHNIRQKFMNTIDITTEIFNELNGNPVDLILPWDKLDEDKFEQLCYDIIGESEAFDPDTRRLMGKTRSRDGGRDIEVHSRRRLGVDPVKWIIQCKFTKKNNSLSGSKVKIVDEIFVHGAGGFIIMTNARIDSTLHDKLEDVSRNYGKEFDEWDVLRIERILARPSHRNIKKRYFGI